MRTAVGIAIIVIACSGLAQGQSLPSAGGVPRLGSECAEKGKLMLLGTVIDPALTKYQTSHYDAHTNRCYVDLTVRSANNVNRNLFDGQTNDLLAVARIQNCKKIGMMIDRRDGKLKHAEWDAATAYINAAMANERR